ncbi:hypothetical protein ADUPG1_004740, partial [Aduncisulcus paluster]
SDDLPLNRVYSDAQLEFYPRSGMTIQPENSVSGTSLEKGHVSFSAAFLFSFPLA